MPLRFRNIDVTPDAPVREWGFEGMLAALDRGYAPHWSRLASAVASEPGLREVFEESAEAAESRQTVALVREMISHRQRTTSEIAQERLRSAQRASGLTQRELASTLGTSASRLSTYLSGRVTPAMDVLVAAEELADREVALRNARELILR
ncbi:helix-turn-helix transcriptional regulator [Microbacterium schleiferi]|uniref:helix-turn-helix domain-containing protein n=1 Tax=Microbacterium schleiferi TaxID=69362 RepID=UPI00311D68AC